MEFAASPPWTNGTLTKYFKITSDCCYKIPNDVGTGKTLGLDEAVSIEPLAVAVHSVRQVDVQPGDKVVVFGAGTVGLLCAAVAREFGASTIVCVDPSRQKLGFAHSFISTEHLAFATSIPNQTLSAEENALCLHGLHHKLTVPHTDVPGFDVAIEATGAESCIQMAVHALRVGGRFVQTGLGKREVVFPISTVSENEITVKGCFRYGPADFKMALEMVSTKNIELKSFITNVFPFEKVVEAWETTKRGEGIKTLIRGPGLWRNLCEEAIGNSYSIASERQEICQCIDY